MGHENNYGSESQAHESSQRHSQRPSYKKLPGKWWQTGHRFPRRFRAEIREMETNSPPVPAGAQIKQVEEDGTEFTIACEDGTNFSLQLTDPGSSVSVRDENDKIEYVG